LVYNSTKLVILPIGIGTYFLIFLNFLTVLILLKKNYFYVKLNFLDFLIILFISINFLSILNVVALNNSIVVYIKGLSYCLLPMTGYFMFSLSKNFNYQSVNKFLNIYLITTVFSIVVGVYFFLFQPSFYVNYILKSYEGFITENDSLFQFRLLSYYGDPTLMGNIACVSLAVLFYLKRCKFNYLQNKHTAIFLQIIIITGIILSFARSAWVASLFILFINQLTISKIKLIKFAFYATLFIMAFIIFNKYLEDYLLYSFVEERFSSLTTSFKERNGQLEWGKNTFLNNPLGIGLGQAGHKSFTGDISRGVYDNNYLRILVELGVQGALSFLSLISFALYLSYKEIKNKQHKKIYFLILSVLFIFFFQSIGSNIIDLHYSSFIFWSFIGILSLLEKNKSTLNQFPIS
jgi:O-antigen ligase